MSAQVRARRILWAAMLSSVILQLFVVQMVPLQDAFEQSDTLVAILAVVALAAVAASFWFRHRFFVNPSEGQKHAGFIIAIALAEVPAILGVVTRFTAGAPQYWAFFLLALIAMVLHFPAGD